MKTYNTRIRERLLKLSRARDAYYNYCVVAVYVMRTRTGDRTKDIRVNTTSLYDDDLVYVRLCGPQTRNHFSRTGVMSL